MKKFLVGCLAVTGLLSFAGTPVWNGLFGKLKTIAICAPGLPGDPAEVDLALKQLREAGYTVKVMPHARNNEANGKLVNAKLRTADFVQAYLDPEVDAVWCVRGGKGSIAVARRVDWEKLRSRKIPVVGFSNITELHGVMQKNQVGHVFSGPSLTQLTKCDPASVAWFGRSIAKAKQPVIQLEVVRGGNCSGYPAGGHLTLYKGIYCSGNAPLSDGKIIFLESPRGKPLNISAKELEQLRQAGCFDRCAAVVFGHIKGKKSEVDKLIKDFAAKVKNPVYRNFPYGHQKNNFLIDFERKVSISVDGKLLTE